VFDKVVSDTSIAKFLWNAFDMPFCWGRNCFSGEVIVLNCVLSCMEHHISPLGS
jgi:hypothetical protein